jgi:hypothetical protein
MKSFTLRLAGREEGPYAGSQIAQMFADRRVNRSTPCKPETGGDWKTIDEYLPMLKYGTQLPPPTPKPTAAITAPAAPYIRVALVDLDIPFLSILKMMFKWMAAGFVVACCFLPLVLAAWFFIFAAVVSFFGHAFSTPHQP